MVTILAGSLLSEILLVLAIFLVLYVIFKLGSLLFGLLLNVVVGFISIFALNWIFGLGIAFNLVVIIITAILGLPGVALIVLLKLIGITL